MLGESYEFIGLMDHLQDRGILDSGDYFVVGVCTNTYDSSNSRNFLEGKANEGVGGTVTCLC